MSIDHSARLMLGWKIEDGDEPGFWFDDEEYLVDDAWTILDPIGEKYDTYGYDLVCEVNSICCDEGYVIGIPMEFGPVPISEFAERLVGMEEDACEVWRKVMRCEPTSRPNVISFVQVW